MMPITTTLLTLASLLFHPAAGFVASRELAAAGTLPMCPTLPQADGLPPPPVGWNLKAIFLSPQQHSYKCGDSREMPPGEPPPHYGFGKAPLFDVGSLLHTNKALFGKLSTYEALERDLVRGKPFGEVHYIPPLPERWRPGVALARIVGSRNEVFFRGAAKVEVRPPSKDEAFGIDAAPPLDWTLFEDDQTLVYQVNTVGGAGYQFCSPKLLQEQGYIRRKAAVQYWVYKRTDEPGVTGDRKPAKLCLNGSARASSATALSFHRYREQLPA